MSSASSSPAAEAVSATTTRATSVVPSEAPEQMRSEAGEGKARPGQFRQPAEIECWGHRGASAHLPENT